MLEKCVLTVLELNGNKRLGLEHLSSYAHVVHTTAKLVISRRRKNETVFKMSKDEKCTCKACKNVVFHSQICKFMGFLLPSSSCSCLLKLLSSECQSSSSPHIFRENYCSFKFCNIAKKCYLSFQCQLLSLLLQQLWMKGLKRSGLEVTRTPTSAIPVQGPVSRKSRNFSGAFRVTEFSLYLQN